MLGLASGPPQGFQNGEKPGVPLSVKADVQGGAQQKTIGLIIEGAAGEVYQPGVTKNGAVSPPPKFTVLDESGATIGSGSFEYGLGGVCRYSWRVPEGFTGKYHVRVDADLGPVAVKPDETWHLIE